eukprot:4356729-Pleurochrysis_carterae.AAC.3
MMTSEALLAPVDSYFRRTYFVILSRSVINNFLGVWGLHRFFANCTRTHARAIAQRRRAVLAVRFIVPPPLLARPLASFSQL